MGQVRKSAEYTQTSGHTGKPTMSLNSVNTNYGAMVALASLNSTSQGAEGDLDRL
jgi:hypothetical protein